MSSFFCCSTWTASWCSCSSRCPSAWSSPPPSQSPPGSRALGAHGAHTCLQRFCISHNHRIEMLILFKSQIYIGPQKMYTYTIQSQDWPASVQVPFTSAPELPPICSAIFLKFIPLIIFVFIFVFVFVITFVFVCVFLNNRMPHLVRFIFLEWILRMSRRASSFGGGNSIFLNCTILNPLRLLEHSQLDDEIGS